MSTNTDKVQARISPDLKHGAEQVFKRLSISPTEAIRMFYRQVQLRQGLPFDVRIPNERTLRAIEEAHTSDDLEAFDTVEELFADIDEDE